MSVEGIRLGRAGTERGTSAAVIRPETQDGIPEPITDIQSSQLKNIACTEAKFNFEKSFVQDNGYVCSLVSLSSLSLSYTIERRYY